VWVQLPSTAYSVSEKKTFRIRYFFHKDEIISNCKALEISPGLF
jgi:hypothetical protein